MIMASTNDNGNQEAEIVYKTKLVHFLGRSVPIILQNDNGPCPLLAICNVLLLRNNVHLSPDITEVASSRLLSLVAERLLDSNSNIESKDEEYARNQQQNISDALSLLRNLVTGLDVNVRFRGIQDFEFTPECAVFDLLDIGLVHGWLCDPQDEITSKILEVNSYNTLVERLVELQTSRADSKALASADSIDFAAATTATLGVPSPSRAMLLKTTSFEDSDSSEVVKNLQQRKGDVEETAQLLEALKLSSVDNSPNVQEEVKPAMSPEEPVGRLDGKHDNLVFPAETESSSSTNGKEEWCLVPPEVEPTNSGPYPTMHAGFECKQLDTGDGHDMADSVESVRDREIGQSKEESRNISSNNLLPIFDEDRSNIHSAKGGLEVLDLQVRPLVFSEADVLEGAAAEHEVIDHQTLGRVDQMPLGSNVESTSSEPLYEGEAEASVATSAIESREPLYEGEAILAGCTEQIGREEEGVCINNFLKSNATQLTYYGLFCLQEGLKERELCVFFRNNHFSTMFKYNGDLYLLVTDQGYLNQPDIVWEKLDEVHGDTVFVTGIFTPFKAGESSGLWDEQGAIAATADYLSSQQQAMIGTKDPVGNNSDLELAMSLQHQEFEQQHHQHQARPASSAPVRHPHTVDSTMRPDGSRLVTGPKKSSYLPHKPELKSKCAVM